MTISEGGVGDWLGDVECFEKSRCNEGFFSRIAREAIEADRPSAEMEEEKESEGVDFRCVSGLRGILSRGPGNWNRDSGSVCVDRKHGIGREIGSASSKESGESDDSCSTHSSTSVSGLTNWMGDPDDDGTDEESVEHERDGGECGSANLKFKDVGVTGRPPRDK